MSNKYYIKRDQKLIIYNPNGIDYNYENGEKKYNLGPLNSPIYHNVNKDKSSKDKITLKIKEKSPRIRIYNNVLPNYNLLNYNKSQLIHNYPIVKYGNPEYDYYDSNLLSKYTKYFFIKLVKSWFYADFQDLLDYVIIDNKKISLIKDIKQLKKNKNKGSIHKKINFIINNIFTKYSLKSLIKKFCIKSGLTLDDLYKYKFHLKKSIYLKIKSILHKYVLKN